MADKKASNNKSIIIGICSAIVVIIVIVAIAAIIGSSRSLNDSYFVSDGNKYVLSIDYSSIAAEIDTSEEEAQYLPNKIHQVYEYSGDTITSLKYYYEYNDEDAAQKALAYFQTENSSINAATDGKYVIVTANEEDYSGYTASAVKEMIEDYQQSVNSSTSSEAETEAETEE